jgi:hypothetical protein
MRAAAERAVTHPALRWTAGDDDPTAHRRGRDGAACGAPGVLRLADADAHLCPDCYPRTGT